MPEPRMLGDRYEIESPLGRGGMATVYRARDRVLDRAVAVKLLAERYAGDQKFVTRFQREARAAAGLNHPNIVSVFDTGAEDGEHYIVMELIQGETLADLLGREGALSPERAARIASGIATALQAAHDEGVVHRDVKPGNVMLTPRGDVKVMDFGIARAATDDTLTQTGLVLGTASYLSPEQSRGDTVDHRSDVYALGCVLYEMLTGRPPFAGESPVSVAYRHVHDEPEPPSRVNPDVPPRLEAVVMRALEKDPGDRYGSADELRTAIGAAGADESTEPLGDTAVLAEETEPLPSAGPRSRAGVLVAILVIAALAAAALAVAMAGSDQRERAPRRERARDRPSPTAEPSPTGTVTVDLAAATIGFRELVTGFVERGLITEELGLQLAEDERKATEEYLKGKLEEAFKHLDEADARVEAALAAGEIAGPEVAEQLLATTDVLRQAMAAAPPPDPEIDEEKGEDGEEDEEGCDSAGPGNSGCAPGHNKEKDD